jgi:hypothetical protein
VAGCCGGVGEDCYAAALREGVLVKMLGGKRGEVPFSAHEHVAAVDSNELHL